MNVMLHHTGLHVVNEIIHHKVNRMMIMNMLFWSWGETITWNYHITIDVLFLLSPEKKWVEIEIDDFLINLRKNTAVVFL